jgi:hypothetical protein
MSLVVTLADGRRIATLVGLDEGLVRLAWHQSQGAVLQTASTAIGCKMPVRYSDYTI